MAKTNFLFNMSHDIRTPMNAIIGFTTLLSKNRENPAKVEDYLNKLEASGQFLLSLINNVLEMARIESGNMSLQEDVQDVRELTDSVIDVFTDQMKQKGLIFKLTADFEHQYVYCDIVKVREIFLNIISNAYKYTPEGGSVNVTVEEIPSGKAGYAAYRTTIKDTGIGMSEEFLPHLFEEFSREASTTESRIEGTGLGMPIVQRFVGLMEGKIEVSSKPGEGTTFVVILTHKIAERLQKQAVKGEEVVTNNFAGKRILLAEDNELNAEIAIEILREAGFVVELAVDGIRCVEMLQAAAAGYYDVILMDIQMPGMNGYEATGVIRGLGDVKKKRIPIIAMTANAFAEDKQNALRAGMNGHIAKPIDVEEMLRTLAGVLG